MLASPAQVATGGSSSAPQRWTAKSPQKTSDLNPAASQTVRRGLCGLTFLSRGGDAEELFAISCDANHAASLLQAELLQRGAPTELRFREGEFPDVSLEDVSRNGINSD